MITESDVHAAEARMQELLQKSPRAVKARYDRRVSRIVISLSTGLELAIPPHIVEGMEHARPADFLQIEISPSGLGIHFPALDVDLYLPGLLEGKFGSEQWMEQGAKRLLTGKALQAGRRMG